MAGLKVVSMPKQLRNPYEEESSTGEPKALGSLKGSNRVVGPTDASAHLGGAASSTRVPKAGRRLIIAGNDPTPVAPALKQAAQRA
jgi:hypothetical protein